ncbi:MBL fold metallo-hydrolase [Acuticoccus kandeliae]|uniref:MBL fold metallo-hydrolase n=1 Tax=Acuticoccus kandeliae TaxID=2073160 RepID=UPI000D3E0CCE|nr:MBL fold metallo-hydrolase [Acuticoccus kandeliae]
MPAFICTTCGTQYAPTETPPGECIICEEERQYLQPTGQAWTTLERLNITHKAIFHPEYEFLSIGNAPAFGINQRALLVRTPEGNILWDCISLINPAMVEIINGLGGIQAIAISHPHYYTTLVEWSRAFGDIPVYLHAADAEWVMRPDHCITHWMGETHEILPGLTLIRAGGHYTGGTVLHVASAAEGRGALLSGDILQVVADRKHLGFMRSYPNFIPLGEAAVRAIGERVAPFRYDAIYGAFWERSIPTGAEAAVKASIDRHIHWLNQGAD